MPGVKGPGREAAISISDIPLEQIRVFCLPCNIHIEVPDRVVTRKVSLVFVYCLTHVACGNRTCGSQEYVSRS